MQKKCRYCFRPFSGDRGICGVCGIDPAKSKNELTKSEKLTHYWCRTLYIMGFLAIVGGIAGVLAGGIGMWLSYTGQVMRSNLAWYGLNFIMAAIFIVFGLALRRYKAWCYRAGIVLYSFVILSGVLTRQPFSALLGILFLYYIASPLSRKILYGKKTEAFN